MALNCGTDNFQAAGCLPGTTTPGAGAGCNIGLVANGTMVCYQAPTLPVTVGGGLFLDPLKVGNYSIINERCTNSTGSIFDLTRIATGGISEGARIFWIVFVSVLALVVVVTGVVMMNMRAQGTKPSGGLKNNTMEGGYPNPRAYGYQPNPRMMY